ncbi:type II CRISPR RNA-guided endonuclease Cas9 [Candidatus Woesearchaeota archaeon]|nr:type II CRISPR RNA-guided endonuclease Cas9 [Candidatus Woesearchaeota archaeon]
MTKILGLDLGTNSIGWAIVEKEDNEFLLIDKGARIFSEGVKTEKGVESSRAAERTNFRSARRIKFRRKLRKYETLMILSMNNMCPLPIDEVKEWRKSGFKKYPLNPEFLQWLRTDDEKNINPYYFRNKASKQKATLYEIGRAFYHIAQRRGFLSNRLDQSADGIIEQHAPNLENRIEEIQNSNDLQNEIKDYFDGLDILDKNAKDLDEGEKKLKTLYNALEKIIKANPKDFEKAKEEVIARLNRKEDLGVVKQKIGEISQVMKDGNFETLGQYLFSLYNKGKIRNQYTAREEHYLAEFEIICKTQGIDGIIETEQLPEKRYFGLAKDIYKAIFFQRPLKSQKGLIGKCSFEKSKSRCAISHPDYEEYRMWTYINSIKIKTPEDEILRFLTFEERQKIVPKFFRKKDSFNFEDIAKELIPKGETFEFYKSFNAKETNYLFNYKPKDSVAGCIVSASLKNVFGEDWKTKNYQYKTKNAKGEIVNRNVDYKDLWHLLSVSTTDIYLYEYAKEKLGIDEKSAKSFSKIKLKKDFAALSLNAINKILPYVRTGLLYSHAVFMANIEKIVDEKIWKDHIQRKYIQDKIAEIIDNHVYENGLLDAVNSLIKDCKKDNNYYSKEAEKNFKDDLEKKLISFYKYHKIVENKEQILNMVFPVFIEQLKKYEFVKIKRLDEKVLEFLSGKNEDGVVFCTNEKQLKKLYHPSDIDVFKKKIVDGKIVLGSPLTSSIKNPMAMRALHQLRKVLNTLILEGQIDSKTTIHIEMARELNDANKRKGIQDFQNENKKNRESYREEIKKLYLEETKKEIEPTEDDILRYQLWIEQDKKEIYEQGKSIGIAQIIGNNPDYDIEHTIPRSISQDNSLMNKTLCSQRFNRDIKKNKMPFELTNHEEILLRIDHWRKEAEKISWEIDQIVKSTKAAATKEAKDRKIRRRHYLSLKRDYLKGKYDRFVWEEPKVGFKNSQIPDIGVITKYAQAYLKSYFNRVESVKGGMVAEFRKIWGIQQSYQENGKKYYEVKDRSKHTHHTIDAITMACMTKDKYDVLASAWTLEDKEQINDARKLLANSKPWKTFTEDLKQIEDEILISHYTPDNVKKQSKKIVRIRGKKQYVAEITRDNNGNTVPKKDSFGKIIYKLNKEGKRIPRLQQGDTVRGSLHQDSIYGAIKDPLNQEEIRYVIRKDLESLKTADIENIVDAAVKDIIKEAMTNATLSISSNSQQKNKLNDIVWMNKEKGIPIKKVRIYANSVKNPLDIKYHADLSISKQEHKQKVYAQNDENFAIIIYEGFDKKGKIKRSFEIVNNIDAGLYYRLSNRELKKTYDIVTNPHDKTGFPLKYTLKKGLMVLFYKEHPEEILELSEVELYKRLYKLSKFDSQGRLTFRAHFEARPASELKEIYDVDFQNPFEQIRLQVNKLKMMVEGYEFNITTTGKINFI